MGMKSRIVTATILVSFSKDGFDIRQAFAVDRLIKQAMAINGTDSCSTLVPVVCGSRRTLLPTRASRAGEIRKCSQACQLSLSKVLKWLGEVLAIHILDLPAVTCFSAPANLNVPVNSNKGPKTCPALFH
jgi:hypothetical protein